MADKIACIASPGEPGHFRTAELYLAACTVAWGLPMSSESDDPRPGLTITIPMVIGIKADGNEKITYVFRNLIFVDGRLAEVGPIKTQVASS